MVSKKTSKKRIERRILNSEFKGASEMFQRKPQKRGLKVRYRVLVRSGKNPIVSKKTSKKRIESILFIVP